MLAVHQRYDKPAIAVRRASEFADMIVDNFDEMRHQSARQPLVMGIALHPYIMGRPFRLRHLRRALRHISDRAKYGFAAPATSPRGTTNRQAPVQPTKSSRDTWRSSFGE